MVVRGAVILSAEAFIETQSHAWTTEEDNDFFFVDALLTEGGGPLLVLVIGV